MRKVGLCLTSLSLIFGLSFSSIPTASAEILYPSWDSSTSDEGSAKILSSYGVDYEELLAKVEDDFKFLFTEVITQDATGRWFVKDPDSPALMGFSSYEISTFVDFLESPDYS